MRFILTSIITLILIPSCSIEIPAVREKIALAGSSNDSIFIIDKETREIEWSYPIPQGDVECNSVAVNSDGSVLFSYRRGARLVSKDKQVIWDVQRMHESEEIQTALFNNEGFILASCGNPASISETDKFGNRTKIIRFDTEIDNIHGQFRQIAKAKNGNYLVPLISKNEILEINGEGEKVNVIPIESGAFSLYELPDGNIMVTHKTKIVTYDRNGKIVATFTPENSDYLTQTIINSEGNLMIANWQGYSQDSQWQIMELDSLKNSVWKFNKPLRIKNISAFYEFQQ